MSIKEKQFNSPEDLNHVEPQHTIPAESERELTGAEKAVPPGILLGNWVNVNPASRGLVKINLAIVSGKFVVHPFGACSPTPCDWGALGGTAYAANVDSNVPVAFSAVFSASFNDTIVTGQLSGALLIVETYSRFKDGSSRSDYYMRETFRRS